MMRMVDLVCDTCGSEREVLIRNIHEPDYPSCCDQTMTRVFRPAQRLVRDDIPGGVLIEHGICNPDGTPKRYYSRSEIKLACAVKGIVPYHEIYQEQGNRILEDARHRDDFLKSGQAKREKRWRDEARAEKRWAESRR